MSDAVSNGRRFRILYIVDDFGREYVAAAVEFNDDLAEATLAAKYERKIAELERKVSQLTMEVDLLKKGAQLGRRASAATYSIVSGP